MEVISLTKSKKNETKQSKSTGAKGSNDKSADFGSEFATETAVQHNRPKATKGKNK